MGIHITAQSLVDHDDAVVIARMASGLFSTAQGLTGNGQMAMGGSTIASVGRQFPSSSAQSEP